MNLNKAIEKAIKNAVKALYNITLETVELQETRKEFEGDITVVVFSMLRFIKGNPTEIATSIGAYVQEKEAFVVGFNVIKGFLNLSIAASYYVETFSQIRSNSSFGIVPINTTNPSIMVEYSSPNTNKPLHLGHVRNNVLGYSVSQILKAAGAKVYKTQIVNDRGIHICKSMVAWKRFGNAETPESTGIKGDKFVGNYYVKFDKEYKKEITTLQEQGQTEEEAKKNAPIFKEAQEMLRKWEAGDAETLALWNTMNQWVYDGFAETYKNLGVDFDCIYYESNTYLLGKEVIEEGLQKGVFYTKADGSVWCDLTSEGLDEKLVLRSDGTAVYITQDIGTAIQRTKDYPDVGGMVYTVGNEQEYHFQVLFLILKKLGYSWAENLYHLSYGMVDLPSGKMKSREGTVVDADDLIVEMTTTAENISKDLGKLEGYTEAEKQDLYKIIGLGALKYYLLKVDPRKRILFDPKESIDFQGNTGPFIQYTYARIQSILRKNTEDISQKIESNTIQLQERERILIKQILQFPEAIQNAAANHNPATIANYTYDLVKEFNSFYQNVPILGATNSAEKIFRVQLSQTVANTIKNAFSLLGIQVPERM